MFSNQSTFSRSLTDDAVLGYAGSLRTARLFLWRHRARARLCSTTRGVTLVEVLIVVAIIAMVAGGVAFFALPRFKESQIKSAEVGARVIRQAVQSWQMSTGEAGCPTVSQLVQDKQLDPGANSNDPWGQAYLLNCTEDDVIVTSAGPDKKKGSKDDIVVPKGASAQTPE